MKKLIISAVLSVSMLLPMAAFANSYPYSPVMDPGPGTYDPVTGVYHSLPTCITIDRNLSIGMSEATLRTGEIAALQNLLRSLNYFNTTSSGYFGSITLASVKAYQKANGIPATGFVGPLTRAKLNSLLCKTQVPPPTSSLQVTSPKGGEVWQPGTVQYINWNDSNTYIQAQTYDITLAPKSPCEDRVGPCPLFLIKPYTIASGVTRYTNGYAWNVGSQIEADRSIPNGQYRITICTKGGSNCAQSNVFTIGTSTATSTTTQ